jgi:hypothetical protein
LSGESKRAHPRREQNMTRSIRHRYDDPLDLVWLACARECGIEVVRSADVYASWDGKSRLTLSASEHFDADDSLAQLIFHELCHALVAGPRGLKRADWGMENVDERDLVSEHACHRLQARLADAHGLRGLLAVTTDHRTYWDALPIDPLGAGDDQAIPLARDAYQRAIEGPWAKAIARALSRTAEIAALVRGAGAGEGSVWSETVPLHASGFPLARDEKQRCADCAWCYADGALFRCRQTRVSARERGQRVIPAERGCVRFEATFEDEECGACGACCREAFDRVDVRKQDLIRKHHPELVACDGYGEHVPRPGGRCVALTGDGASEHYRCRVYAERPRSCAEFAVRGDACLTARRRVSRSA